MSTTVIVIVITEVMILFVLITALIACYFEPGRKP